MANLDLGDAVVTAGGRIWLLWSTDNDIRLRELEVTGDLHVMAVRS